MVILSHDIKFGPDLDRWKYCDVRLTTDDSYSFIHVHRNLLAQVSPVLKELFDRNRNSNPDAYISALRVRKVNFDALEKIIELVYEGKIKIHNDNVERQIMTGIKQLQIDIKINHDVAMEAGRISKNNRPCKNVHFETDSVLIIEEIKNSTTERISLSPNQEDSSKVCGSNRKEELGKAHLLHEERYSNTSSAGGKQCQQTSLGQGVSFKSESVPLPVPSSHSLILQGKDTSKERGRSASSLKASSYEAVKSKQIKVRPNISKDVGGNDVNDNLDDLRKEDQSRKEVENKSLGKNGVKQEVSIEDLVSYLESFSVDVKYLVDSISVSTGDGFVHLRSAVSPGHFDQLLFELKRAKTRIRNNSIETTHQLSLPCKEYSQEERQENASIESSPLPVPASHSLTLQVEDISKGEGRSASCLKSKLIKVRPDIFKDVGANDINENLIDSRKEDKSLKEVENESWRKSRVKQKVSIEDLVSYLDLFSVHVESLVESILLSEGNGFVHFKGAVFPEYFDRLLFELKCAKISTSIIPIETSHYLSSPCKESSQQERQGNASIKSLPLQIPASHPLTLQVEGNSKKRGLSSSCLNPSSDEVVKPKRIRMRLDIFKDVQVTDLNYNLDDPGKEDISLNEVENKTLKITGVKQTVSDKDLISYLESFSVNDKCLVESLSVSGGMGLVHFKSALSVGYFNQHEFVLRNAKIKLSHPKKKNLRKRKD